MDPARGSVGAIKTAVDPDEHTQTKLTHGRHKAQDFSVVNETASWVTTCNASVGSPIYSQGIGKNVWCMMMSPDCTMNSGTIIGCTVIARTVFERGWAAKMHNLARWSELVPKNLEDEPWLNSLWSLWLTRGVLTRHRSSRLHELLLTYSNPHKLQR